MLPRFFYVPILELQIQRFVAHAVVLIDGASNFRALQGLLHHWPQAYGKNHLDLADLRCSSTVALLDERTSNGAEFWHRTKPLQGHLSPVGAPIPKSWVEIVTVILAGCGLMRI